MSSQFQSIAAFAMLALGTCCLSGCGSGTNNPVPTEPTPPTNSTGFKGIVFAGGNPVVGASVQVYAASSNGYSASSNALLSSTVTTDSTGSFAITPSQYTCSNSSSQIYLLAQGPSSKPALTFLTAAGACGNIVATDTFMLNEVTTAAFVWALAPFMSSATAVGSSATNATGLQNAFASAAVLADIFTGKSPAAGTAASLQIETAKVYSLANSLSPCATAVSTTGACTTLFSLATQGGIVPTNTAAAALAIVKHPASNTSAIYQLGTTSPPFTGLATAPSDWTMSIASTGGGLSYPASVGIDSTGRAWVANYPGIVSAFTVEGMPVFASGLTSSGLSEELGLTIDPSDNVWVTNGLQNSIFEFSSSGAVLSGASGFSGGGIDYPIAAASDSAGNIWVVNNGNGSVTKLSNSGIPANSSGYTGSSTLYFPSSVAISADNTPWIVSQTGTATHLSTSGALIRTVSCCAIPTGIAIDPEGDVWVADHYANAIVHISSASGTILSSTSSGGVFNPNDLAVDGASNVWAVNDFTGSLTEIAGSTSASPGTALSPSTGYGVDAKMQSPYGIAVDASGNLWVSSYYDARLVRFIGLATPVKTPLVSAPQLP